MRPPDDVWTSLRRPCVYAWMRGEECLYVGSSSESAGARLRHHHVIDRVERWRRGDVLNVWHVEPHVMDDAEAELIDVLKPTLNSRIPPAVARARQREKRKR